MFKDRLSVLYVKLELTPVIQVLFQAMCASFVQQANLPQTVPSVLKIVVATQATQARTVTAPVKLVFPARSKHRPALRHALAVFRALIKI